MNKIDLVLLTAVDVRLACAVVVDGRRVHLQRPIGRSVHRQRGRQWPAAAVPPANTTPAALWYKSDSSTNSLLRTCGPKS